MWIMFIKIIFISIIAIILSFYYGDKSTDIISSLFSVVVSSKTLSNSTTRKLFTKKQLKLYNGVDKPELYISILGRIFDVTRGIKHYGPNQQYNIFVGRDASRCFVTGKFNIDDISDEVADFGNDDLRSLNYWLNFYKKEYKIVGKLIGRYFDNNGNQTPYGRAVKMMLKEAEREKEKDHLEKVKFPPCNVEWNVETGTRIWCSKKSGGIERDWSGMPYQLYEPGSKTYRCACINEHNEKLGSIKEYEDCDKSTFSCFIKGS
ncbi:hypothetical protein NQ317_013872 [Molorchus minor]|uniref:Cytochrome b5 heme-binding domain-containing protein n=1 Tax=Molorchus minor TaxID=1323400 RepID=A0ABQ9K8M9_9CUCU|nr:hypothetical protein NQ317_013872 [Molorchus minor]